MRNIRKLSLLTAMAGMFMGVPLAQASPLSPDLDGNCVLDEGDYYVLEIFFADEDLRADFDGDGVLTHEDVLGFLNAYHHYTAGGGSLPGCGSSLSLHAAPDGTGGSCSEASPCSVETALSQASDGSIIHLASGQYGDLLIDGLEFSDFVTLVPNVRHDAKFDDIEIRNSSNIRLDGISNRKINDFTGHGTRIGDSRNIELLNVVLSGPGRHTNEDALGVWDSTDILVEGSDISLGNRVFHSNSQNVTLRNNDFHGSAGTTVRFTGNTVVVEGMLVEGNKIHDASHEVAEDNYCIHDGPQPYWGDGECVFDPDKGKMAYVHGSTENPHENLLILRGIQNALIRKNHIFDSRALGVTVRDGADDTTPYSGENIVFENNLIEDKLTAYSGAISLRNNIITGSLAIGADNEGAFGMSRLDAMENNIVAYNIYMNFCNHVDGKRPDEVCTNPTTLAPDAPVNRNIIRGSLDFNQFKGTVAMLEQGVGNNVYYRGLGGGCDTCSTRRETPMELFVDPDNQDYTLIPGKLTTCPEDAVVRGNPPGDYSINCGISPIDYIPASAASEFDANGKRRVNIVGVGSETDIADIGPFEYHVPKVLTRATTSSSGD